MTFVLPTEIRDGDARRRPCVSGSSSHHLLASAPSASTGLLVRERRASQGRQERPRWPCCAKPSRRFPWTALAQPVLAADSRARTRCDLRAPASPARSCRTTSGKDSNRHWQARRHAEPDWAQAASEVGRREGRWVALEYCDAFVAAFRRRVR